MKEILEKHRLAVEEFRIKQSAIDAEREKIAARISRAQAQMLKLEKKENALYRPTNYDIVVALAKKLSEHYGLSWLMTGPYDTMKTMGIHLLRKGSNDRMKDELAYLILRLNDPQGEGWLTYYTGHNSGDISKGPSVYPLGHLGAFDEKTAEYALLPKEFNKILELINYIGSAVN